MRIVIVFLTFNLVSMGISAVEPTNFRQRTQPVKAIDDKTLLCEAEEFNIESGDWKAKRWGENYYSATFANSFLSRKGFLGTSEQSNNSVASIHVHVPAKGRYLALIRYEAVVRFQTQFTLKVEQGRKVKLKRLYGARDNLKIWAFRQKLKKEVAWSWGAGENVVWEGHDAFVNLDAGPAKLTLIANKQPERAAKRNVDLVMLTRDIEQVNTRIEKENYLPLDGMLTQSGDLYMKVHNLPGRPVLGLTVPKCTEHSPYWVHMRNWKPITIHVQPGQTTKWTEVGSLLDTLNDGQWNLKATASGPSTPGGILYQLEFGVADARGEIQSIRSFKNLTGSVSLAYDADTRYSRRIRLSEQVLYDLLAYLKKQPIRGRAPTQTLIYGYTFTPQPGNPKYNQAIDDFIETIGATALNRTRRGNIEKSSPLIRGYIDVRGRSPAQLEKMCKELKAEGKAKQIAVVSLGDEIGLRRPPRNDHGAFQTWLKTQKLKPEEVDSNASTWGQITLSPDKATAKSNPSLYYYSQLYSYRYGIEQQKKLTDVLKKHLPNAGVGANFSPHHGHMYLGPTHHWISVFRENGMTMPWGEDYIWQVPVGTQQMNFLMLDMFRCAIKEHPDRKIHYYVMPHTPGNTTDNWRRQFIGDIGHGAKIFNLFEFRPVQAAYTENHCSNPAMYQEVRKAIHELGLFEDIVQAGQVRRGMAALWFSETADIWDDYEHPMSAGKRSLYIAIRHHQLPLDCVVDGDKLKDYEILYLTDRHVSREGSKAIAAWVKNGGRLFATAGAGMYDEFNQPNKILRELLGVEEATLQRDEKEIIIRAKEHLPYAKTLDQVTRNNSSTFFPIYGVKSHITNKSGKIIGTFKNGEPAIVQHSVGKGQTIYCAMLPGLSYFKPALPIRPVDRGANSDSLSHFIPSKFDSQARELIGSLAKDLKRPIDCSEPLVESTLIESRKGAIIPLINWSAHPVKQLEVRVHATVPLENVKLASGNRLRKKNTEDGVVLTLDLDVADVLIFRAK